MKKVLVASMLICAFSIGASQFADKAFAAEISDPVEIHPAKTQKMIPMPDDSKVQIKPPESPKEKSAKALAAKVQYNKYRKVRKAAPKKIVINYPEIDKMIEESNFGSAQSAINTAIKQNPKDVRAQALNTVSLAKQNKLDAAQSQVSKLLKTYPNNSDLYFAQGVINYKKTTSSNMAYISTTQKLLLDAQKDFNKAIALDKTNAKAYNAAGVVALNLGQNATAKDLFKKAVAADKTSSTAIDNLGTMDFMDSKFDDAQKKFAKALALNNQNSTAMYHLAQIATVKNNFSQAINYLNKALAINPNSPSINNLIGEVYQNQGNEAAAINAFKKAITLKPEFAQAYLNLAEIYEKRGDSEFALEQLKTILSVNPDFNDAKLKIADLSLSSGKYDQAIQSYSSLVGIKDYNDSALKGLANAYYAKAQSSSTQSLIGSNKDLFNALDYVNKAIIIDNSDLELHLAKLKLAKLTNQPKLSESALNEIVKSQDAGLVSTITKGEAYLALNQYAQAKQSFDKATTLTKDVQEDLYLSEVLVYNRQYDSAKIVIQNILKKDSKNQQALSSLDYIQKSEKQSDNYFKAAQYCAKTRNPNSAMDYLSRSLALNPNNADAYLLLAQLSEKQKNYKAAVYNYKAYLGLAIKASNRTSIEKKIIHLEKK